MKKLAEEGELSRIGDWVLYKNNQLIAFNKPSGLPVQEDKDGEGKALINLAEIYTKSKLWLIHRLDQPASGVVLFAKTKSALVSLNEQFRNREVRKTYLAIVKNQPPEQEGTLIHYLWKNAKTNRSQAFSEEGPGRQKGELHYRVVARSEHYYLLEIQLISGRHHQIRAQLAAIDCPIKGDNKYGASRGNPDRSICLHAWKLDFKHPVSGEWVHLTAPLPEDPLWNAFDY